MNRKAKIKFNGNEASYKAFLAARLLRRRARKLVAAVRPEHLSNVGAVSCELSKARRQLRVKSCAEPRFLTTP